MKVCRRITGFAAILAATLAWASALESTDGTLSPAADAGEHPGAVLFGRYCASCHGAGGKGDGPVAAVLRAKPADLTGIAARRDGEFPLLEIAAFIDGRKTVAAHGPRRMPIWGRRFGSEIDDPTEREEAVTGNLLTLLSWLESIQEK